MKSSVYLALSRERLLGWVAERGAWPSPLWVCANVLTNLELAECRAAGVELTNFLHPIDPQDLGAVEEARDTIAEHHPGRDICLI